MEVESYMSMKMEEEQMELPPGFRFHPTDEELISHYLSPKVIDTKFTTLAIGEADLNKIEPWDLPSKAKIGEKEWYFFVVRDRKYPTGLRTNRATKAGYWKATGKDKEIYRAKALIGMKKTLVFYTGRAPKGEKTSWVMHEYRLQGKFTKFNLPQNAKDDWVICRVFKKNSGAKKTEYIAGGFVSLEKLHPSLLMPSLMDQSPRTTNTCDTKPVTDDITPSCHVTCVSNPSFVMEENEGHPLLQNQQEETRGIFEPPSTSTTTTMTSAVDMVSNMLSEPCISDFQYEDSIFSQDQSMLKLLFQGKSLGSSSSKMELPSFEFSNHGMVCNLDGGGPFDHDCLWDDY